MAKFQKAATGIVRRASGAGRAAKNALEKFRHSAAAKRAKDVMKRRRSTPMAMAMGAAYEMAQQRGFSIPKLPVPLSGEAQHSLAFAWIADSTSGLAQEAALVASHGLGWEAGRKVVRTGSVAGDGDEDVII